MKSSQSDIKREATKIERDDLDTEIKDIQDLVKKALDGNENEKVNKQIEKLKKAGEKAKEKYTTKRIEKFYKISDKIDNIMEKVATKVDDNYVGRQPESIRKEIDGSIKGDKDAIDSLELNQLDESLHSKSIHLIDRLESIGEKLKEKPTEYYASRFENIMSRVNNLRAIADEKYEEKEFEEDLSKINNLLNKKVASAQGRIEEDYGKIDKDLQEARESILKKNIELRNFDHINILLNNYNAPTVFRDGVTLKEYAKNEFDFGDEELEKIKLNDQDLNLKENVIPQPDILQQNINISDITIPAEASNNNAEANPMDIEEPSGHRDEAIKEENPAEQQIVQEVNAPNADIPVVDQNAQIPKTSLEYNWVTEKNKVVNEVYSSEKIYQDSMRAFHKAIIDEIGKEQSAGNTVDTPFYKQLTTYAERYKNLAVDNIDWQNQTIKQMDDKVFKNPKIWEDMTELTRQYDNFNVLLQSDEGKKFWEQAKINYNNNVTNGVIDNKHIMLNENFSSSDYAIMAVQRGPRWGLLIDDILKKDLTNADDNEKLDIIDVLDKVKNNVKNIDAARINSSLNSSILPEAGKVKSLDMQRIELFQKFQTETVEKLNQRFVELTSYRQFSKQNIPTEIKTVNEIKVANIELDKLIDNYRNAIKEIANYKHDGKERTTIVLDEKVYNRIEKLEQNIQELKNNNSKNELLNRETKKIAKIKKAVEKDDYYKGKIKPEEISEIIDKSEKTKESAIRRMTRGLRRSKNLDKEVKPEQANMESRRSSQIRNSTTLESNAIPNVNPQTTTASTSTLSQASQNVVNPNLQANENIAQPNIPKPDTEVQNNAAQNQAPTVNNMRSAIKQDVNKSEPLTQSSVKILGEIEKREALLDEIKQIESKLNRLTATLNVVAGDQGVNWKPKENLTEMQAKAIDLRDNIAPVYTALQDIKTRSVQGGDSDYILNHLKTWSDDFNNNVVQKCVDQKIPIFNDMYIPGSSFDKILEVPTPEATPPESQPQGVDSPAEQGDGLESQGVQPLPQDDLSQVNRVDLPGDQLQANAPQAEANPQAVINNNQAIPQDIPVQQQGDQLQANLQAANAIQNNQQQPEANQHNANVNNQQLNKKSPQPETKFVSKNIEKLLNEYNDFCTTNTNKATISHKKSFNLRTMSREPKWVITFDNRELANNFIKDMENQKLLQSRSSLKEEQRLQRKNSNQHKK